MSNYYKHETAIVDDGAIIGNSSKIWHFSHVMQAVVGEHCNLGQNVFIANKVQIGNNVKIQNNVSLYEGVLIEDDVFIGPSAVFTNVINPRAFISRKEGFKTTLVKKGATIGANSTIICGIVIGRYAFVGAGAMVRRNVPDYGLVIGVPAKHSGWICKCGVTLRFDGKRARCACGNEYEMESNGIRAAREE